MDAAKFYSELEPPELKEQGFLQGLGGPRPQGLEMKLMLVEHELTPLFSLRLESAGNVTL